MKRARMRPMVCLLASVLCLYGMSCAAETVEYDLMTQASWSAVTGSETGCVYADGAYVLSSQGLNGRAGYTVSLETVYRTGMMLVYDMEFDGSALFLSVHNAYPGRFDAPLFENGEAELCLTDRMAVAAGTAPIECTDGNGVRLLCLPAGRYRGSIDFSDALSGESVDLDYVYIWFDGGFVTFRTLEFVSGMEASPDASASTVEMADRNKATPYGGFREADTSHPLPRAAILGITAATATAVGGMAAVVWTVRRRKRDRNKSR